MIRAITRAAAAAALALVLAGGTAAAQKAGGILRVYSAESPPGLNIYEQATPWGQAPLMGGKEDCDNHDGEHDGGSGKRDAGAAD